VIVLAEDDPDVRDILTARFTQAGYDLRTAAHGAEAIELLQHVTPQAVFVDLIMPGVIGHSVLEFMRTHSELKSVPVAIVSGSPELAPAGYAVFPKPVRFHELLEFARNRGGFAS
jgi:DNA-binding response OmpR family regulator